MGPLISGKGWSGSYKAGPDSASHQVRSSQVGGKGKSRLVKSQRCDALCFWLGSAIGQAQEGLPKRQVAEVLAQTRLPFRAITDPLFPQHLPLWISSSLHNSSIGWVWRIHLSPQIPFVGHLSQSSSSRCCLLALSKTAPC